MKGMEVNFATGEVTEIAFFSVVVAAIIGLWVGVSDRIKREGTH